MPKVANVDAFPNNTEASAAAALRALAKILAPFIAAEMGARPANDAEEWIDQHRSPLGRRVHCAAARDGRLTARKVGRRWLVRRHLHANRCREAENSEGRRRHVWSRGRAAGVAPTRVRRRAMVGRPAGFWRSTTSRRASVLILP